MTFNSPSALAAAIRASIPPASSADLTVLKSTAAGAAATGTLVAGAAASATGSEGTAVAGSAGAAAGAAGAQADSVSAPTSMIKTGNETLRCIEFSSFLLRRIGYQ